MACKAGDDGHFFASVDLNCGDDAEAVKQAEYLADGHDIELWQRARKIARFDRKAKIQF